MAREGKAYLTELVESVICVPDAFRIRCLIYKEDCYWQKVYFLIRVVSSCK